MGTSNNAAHRGFDPLVSFTFKVEIDGVEVANFYNVDGLNYEVEMLEYRTSESPNYPMYRQGRRKPLRVTLKRGVLVNGNTALYDWLTEVESGTISTKNIAITVGRYNVKENESESKANSWVLADCMPTKWSLASLDSNSNSALIESLELVVSQIRKQ